MCHELSWLRDIRVSSHGNICHFSDGKKSEENLWERWIPREKERNEIEERCSKVRETQKFENIVEKDKTDAKGHATDNCKEPVKESHAVVIRLIGMT